MACLYVLPHQFDTGKPLETIDANSFYARVFLTVEITRTRPNRRGILKIVQF